MDESEERVESPGARMSAREPRQAVEEPVLEAKAAWLNVPFFFIRMVLYFTGWILLNVFSDVSVVRPTGLNTKYLCVKKL